LKIYIQYSEFRAHSAFQGKRKLLKYPECKKYVQYHEKFQGISVFRASASCSNILNVKSMFDTMKNSRASLFSGQAQVAQISWM